MRILPLDQTDRRAVLHRALRDREFVPHYQPILDARTHRIVAIEALARWNRPSGVVGPDLFLADIERHGLHHQLGARMLLAGMRDVQRLRTRAVGRQRHRVPRERVGGAARRFPLGRRAGGVRERARVPARLADDRVDRDEPAAGPGARGDDARPLPRARRADRARRHGRRLLVPGAAAHDADRRDQDRPVVRVRGGDRRRLPGDHRRARRGRTAARHHGDR